MAVAIAGLIPAKAAAVPDPAPSNELAKVILATYGTPEQLWANCLIENVVGPLPDADFARECEWRIVLGNQVRFGAATAKQSAGVWRIEDVATSGRTYPNEWVRCGRSVAGGRKEGARTIKLKVHGLPCKMGNLPAEIRNEVRKKSLRIPKRFGPIDEGGANSIGLVNFLFSCEANERKHRRNSVVIDAECTNVHGDMYAYKFRLSPPEPKKPKRKPGGGGGGGGGGGSPSCEPGYSPCLPVVGDLDCADIPAHKKPVTVTGSDRYRLDADNDGVGCE